MSQQNKLKLKMTKQLTYHPPKELTYPKMQQSKLPHLKREDDSILKKMILEDEALRKLLLFLLHHTRQCIDSDPRLKKILLRFVGCRQAALNDVCIERREKKRSVKLQVSDC